jgi:hypothetical protein
MNRSTQEARLEARREVGQLMNDHIGARCHHGTSERIGIEDIDGDVISAKRPNGFPDADDLPIPVT